MSFRSTLEIINVEAVQVVPTTKGSYKTVGVAYKDSEGKVAGKKFVSFNDEKMFEQVLGLGPLLEEANKTKTPYRIIVDQEKKASKPGGQEYWHWVSIEPAGNAGEASQVSSGGDVAAGTTSNRSSSAGRVTGSNYETAEERKIKQLNITRQFAVNAALKVIEVNKGKVNLEDLFKSAEQIVDFVYARSPNTPILEMDNDIPV